MVHGLRILLRGIQGRADDPTAVILDGRAVEQDPRRRRHAGQPAGAAGYAGQDQRSDGGRGADAAVQTETGHAVEVTCDAGDDGEADKQSLDDPWAGNGYGSLAGPEPDMLPAPGHIPAVVLRTSLPTYALNCCPAIGFDGSRRGILQIPSMPGVRRGG